MNASLRLGWRTLWRDLRAGELRLLIVAVLLAVAALTAVGFFADRLKGGLQRDARQLLGGDAVLASDNPTPAGLRRARHARSACRARAPTAFRPWRARSDAQGGASKLVALKAVAAGYPLRGNLQVSRRSRTRRARPRATCRRRARPGSMPRCSNRWR